MEGITKIKFGLQANPIVGHNIYVARPDIYSTVSLDAIIAYAAKAAGITQSDMLVTLDAMYDAFTYFVCNGHSFKLDGIGTFSLSVKTKASDATLDFVVEGADAVESIGINFLPAPELKRILDNMAVETYTENENHLVEDTSIFARSIVMGGISLNLLTFDNLKAANANIGSDIIVNGYNFEEGMTAVITGKLANAAVTETIALSLVSRKAQNCLKGKFAKQYDIIEKVQLKLNGATVATYDWTGAPIPVTLVPYIGGVALSDGGVYSVGRSEISIKGDLTGVTVTLDGGIISPSRTSGNVSYFVPTVYAGTHRLVIGSVEYNFKTTEAASANITTLSANGVSVNSGTSSPVISGGTYNFVANGQNTDLVRLQDITVPTGAVVSNFQATSTQVKFTLKMGTVGGTIKIANFTCNLTMQSGTDQPVITSCSEVSAGGTRTVNKSSVYTFTFAGNNLSNNLTARFTPNSFGTIQSVTSSSGSNLSVKVNIASGASGNSTFAVYDTDGATIFSCTMSISSGSMLDGGGGAEG